MRVRSLRFSQLVTAPVANEGVPEPNVDVSPYMSVETKGKSGATYSPRWSWSATAILLYGTLLPPGAAIAQTGFTGVVRIRSTVNARQDTIIQTTKGGRARFDYLCDLVRSCTMIGDSGTHTLMAIEDDRKIYVTITQADSWQLEAMTQTLEPVLRTRLAVSRLWDVSGLKFKKTRRSSQVAGQRCEVWAGHYPGATRDEASEACLGNSGGIAVGLLVGVFKSETTVPPAYDENGLPHKSLNAGLLRLRLVKNGSPTTVEVLSIEPGTVDDSLFDPPAGYEHIRMAAFIKGMQAARQQAERPGPSLSPRPGDSLSYPLPDDPQISKPPSLTVCAWDSLAPAVYQGEGEVTYRVRPNGVPDTATMMVERLYGADLRTFRTAAQKVVAVCRFTQVAADNAPPTLMRQRISFAGGRGRFDSTESEVYIPTDSLELEPVAIVKCEPILHEEGRIRVQMVIGTDGLPEPGKISAVNETTHMQVAEAPIAFAGCVFTPARYKGILVRQKIEFTITSK